MAAEGVEEKGRRTKVMVAIDESECSRYALEWALHHLAEPLASSLPLLLFTVQPFNTLGYIPAAAAGYGSAHALAAVPPAPGLIKSLQEHQRKIALSLLESAEDLCATKGVVTEKITEVGDPKEAICEAVEKFKINLLIMGSHGRGALQRAFLGSISNYCVNNAKCPVLVVKKSV
ncbi:universal stress protein A-like protein isoform X1 [Phoenix dactylifera]|uniref:Universal stress protein A-like protein isoform X1 n=1 Tax=Phoenix dactylifera TaxID=42345 RepID=A0A8B7CF25_PHODC|nr:universal stress protein A-like protein isoform X1 [Phoenix dactylifera]